MSFHIFHCSGGTGILRMKQKDSQLGADGGKLRPSVLVGEEPSSGGSSCTPLIVSSC